MLQEKFVKFFTISVGLIICISADKIRQVGDGTYLSIVYWGRKKLIDFALKFPKQK